MVTSPHPDSLPPAQDFFPPVSRWAQFSGLLIVGALGVAVTLAAVTQYKVTVKGQAIVRPTGELRLVQAAIDSSVKQIFVTENQGVQTGDVIASLDDSQLQTQTNQLQSNIQQAQRQLLQLSAQIRALGSQILAESDRNNRLVASAQAELRLAQRNYQDEQVITSSEVEAAEANVRSAEAALNAARLKVERYRPIAEVGAISQEQLEEARLEVEQQAQAVEVALAELQQSQAALNPSPAEVAIATERIAQERATGVATLAALNREREALVQQQIQIQNQLEQDTQALQQLERDLSKTFITATADGILTQLTLRNPGQTLQSGAAIAHIVPSHAPLVVKASIAAQDISRVKVGQTAQLRISACPYPDYGTLQGVVSTISPDAVVAQNSGTDTGSTPAFYEVTIAPERFTLGQGNQQCSIQLGMEGRADIISRQETVLQFFFRKARLVTDF